jgi:hypothetical protein
MSLFQGENAALGSQATAGGNIIPNTEPVTFVAQAAGQAITQAIFMPDNAASYQVIGVQVVFGTASTSGTVTIEKLTGTTAPGGGTALLTGTVSLAGTANTVLTGTLITNTSTLTIASGNRLGIVFGGTLTNLVGALVVVSLKRV